ncbi:MAG TPA: (Fe-S)-binding protein [Methanothrix sp.]|nr:ArsR family transcriptional regulator [Methanothrix sp.]HPC89728.1 (Fe-S)-binding protein [Methanothrix sp.]HQE87463.1 (Fe-S)-binding protein [Methanothrix sp.]HQI68993.1 (Fe-S)-binding protein [Methanothrix sp.]HRS85162.1 (Fe-S)-binding protein [Methanothrix sp.]
MPGSSADVRLVSNAMANAARRKIMAMLVEKERTREEVEKAAGGGMLDYHLQMLEQAGLAELKGGNIAITEFGRNFLQARSQGPCEAKKELSGTSPIDVVEVRQLLPCIADSSKFRVIARLQPPLGGALKLLEPIFPRARYSERIGALIIQRGSILITIYSTGSVTMTMIGSGEEARRLLDELKTAINQAIVRGVTPAAREKVKVDHAEIYKYLPGTDCRICGEQSCYAFAIRLVAGEASLNRCSPLLEARYAASLEHLTALMEYI